MNEVSWFWEDYEIRNSDDQPCVKKKQVQEHITHCEACGEMLQPTDLKSHRRCNECFAKEKS